MLLSNQCCWTSFNIGQAILQLGGGGGGGGGVGGRCSLGHSNEIHCFSSPARLLFLSSTSKLITHYLVPVGYD